MRHGGWTGSLVVELPVGVEVGKLWCQTSPDVGDGVDLGLHDGDLGVRRAGAALDGAE
jgi:hypothetical protein